MKKLFLSLLAMSLLTTVALAAEDTVDYVGTTYVYGGEAAETTDDNESGYLDGLILRGVDEATYYTAGEGFVYFTPATEDAPAILILDNATLIADYCIQAVTDVDMILVGDNLLQATSPDLFCINVVEAYDSNMEQLAIEDCDFGALTIWGDGTLQVISAGYIAFNVGQFAIHSGDVSMALDDSAFVAIKTNGDYETSDLDGFLMDGGTLDIDLGTSAEWGVDVSSGDIFVSDGMLVISGGGSDSVGVMVSAFTKDAVISFTGGTTVIENNGEVSVAFVKFASDIEIQTTVDFTDDPDGVFALDGFFQFSDTLDVCATTGKVLIPVFDGVTVDSELQLNVIGLSDYMYSTNAYTTYDLDATMLAGFTATLVGQPEITDSIRTGLVYPYATGSNTTTEYTFTRAQIIALLWDSMGCHETVIDNPFTDVSQDDPYYTAILWAVESGITNGATATTFDPDALCTKSQLLTFLYRNAGAPEVDVENIFTDVADTSYVYDAVLWGIANTMMDVDADTFDGDTTVLNDGAIGYLICMFE